MISVVGSDAGVCVGQINELERRLASVITQAFDDSVTVRSIDSCWYKMLLDPNFWQRVAFTTRR